MASRRRGSRVHVHINTHGAERPAFLARPQSLRLQQESQANKHERAHTHRYVQWSFNEGAVEACQRAFVYLCRRVSRISVL